MYDQGINIYYNIMTNDLTKLYFNNTVSCVQVVFKLPLYIIPEPSMQW